MKRISTKVTALLLSLMMAVVFMPVTGFAETGVTWGQAPSGVTVDEINEGEFDVTLDDKEFITYSFTPSTSGNYSFIAENTAEYDEEEEPDCALAAFIDARTGYDEDLDNDDYAEMIAVEKYLKAGRQYYYQVKAVCFTNPQATFHISLTRPAFDNKPEDESLIKNLEMTGDQWSEDVSFEAGNDVKTYRFQAEKDMLYKFWGEGNPEVQLDFTAFDEHGEYVMEYIHHDEEEYTNMFEVNVRVEKDEVYYLQVKGDEEEPVNCKLHLDRIEGWGSPDFESAEAIEVDKSVTRTFKGNIKTFKFTAPEDFAYTLSAKSADGYEAGIYTPDGKFTIWGTDYDSKDNCLVNKSFKASKGQTYYIQFSGDDEESSIKVTIKITKSKIKNIEYVPVGGSFAVYENTFGDWETDSNDDEYFCYRLPDPSNGDELIFTYSDDATKTYVYDEKTYTYRLRIGENELSKDTYINDYDLDWDSWGQEKKHWTLGSENSLEFTYKGFTITVPVSVVENPIESISYTPAEGVEYAFGENAASDGEWDEDRNDKKYFLYDVDDEMLRHDGDILTVTYKDERETVQYKYMQSKEKYVNLADENDTISSDRVEFESDQDSKHWYKNGSDNYLYVTYFAVQSNHLPIVIKKNICKAKVPYSDYTYTGKVKMPSPTVKIGTKTLNKGADYRLETSEYSDYKSVGLHQFWVEGTGEYAGSICKEFKILPKGTTVTKLTKAKKAITVKWKKQSAKMSKKRINGYQVQLATNSKFTKGKKLVTVKGYSKLSKKVTKLKAKKKYYVRVRTYMYVDGYKIYSKWSKAKSITTK